MKPWDRRMVTALVVFCVLCMAFFLALALLALWALLRLW